MTPTMQSLGIDQLPREVRIALVHDIWDSIAAENQSVPLSEALRLELERRRADNDANPENTIPRDQVKANVLAQRKQ